MSQFILQQGEALTQLQALGDESVDCCITSPPYWGLRDYGTGAWEGGDATCDHIYNHGVQGATGDRADRAYTAQAVYKSECRKCGATRVDEQLGLEPTVQEYLVRVVAIFDEVRRVLKKRGTLWLNMGDSYAGSWGSQGRDQGTSPTNMHARQVAAAGRKASKTGSIPSGSKIKAKDLVGVPWMVAFALRDAGWYLRQDIIWSKTNPMPESVRDRCTKAHEYIFLLSKSSRYHCDMEAIQEPAAYAGPNGTQHSPYSQGFGRRTREEEFARQSLRRFPSSWASGEVNHSALMHNRPHANGRGKVKQVGGGFLTSNVIALTENRPASGGRDRAAESLVVHGNYVGRGDGGRLQGKGNSKTFRGGGIYTNHLAFDNSEPVERDSHGNAPNESMSRNRRSVWTVATQPFAEAHFATFPEKLIEPCVLAGCPPGGVILDPFSGSGTTGIVATRHGRNYVGLELNPEYVEMSRRRLNSECPLFITEAS